MQSSADAVAPGSSAKAMQGASWQKYVARCAAGDQAALAALYDASSRLVYSLILTIVRNPADADEVTMDVYTTVWNSALRYDDSRGGVFRWLVMLARGRAIDRARSRAWRQQREDGSDFLDCAAPGLSPEAQAEASKERGNYWRRWKSYARGNAGCCGWPSLRGIRIGNWLNFCSNHSAR